MFWYLLVSAALAGTSAAPTAYVVPNDSATCAEDLTKWCDDKEFSEDTRSIMISTGIQLPGEGVSGVFCIMDPYGANCEKNGQPWFSCSDHEFLYKGKKLDPENPEEGICETAETAFNDILRQIDPTYT